MRPNKSKFIAALIVVAAITCAAAHTASAGLGIACPAPTTEAFLRWADPAFYAFMPDGGFEGGGSGWTLTSGATIAKGNESYSVRGDGGSHSLYLPPGSSATTPPMCIGVLSTKMRFFVKPGSAKAEGSRLVVRAVYRGGLGAVLGITDIASISASGTTWSPSPPITLLGGLLPLLTKSVQFVFVPQGAGGWAVDDAYLDPLMHG